MAECPDCKKRKGLKKYDGYCRICVDELLRFDDYDVINDESEIKIIFGKARKDSRLTLAEEF